MSLFRIFLIALVAVTAGTAQNTQSFLADFEKRVTEFTLSNGLHFIVLERHDAPVVSFHSYVNAGSVNDPRGETGIAHMFEHMAFKGTPQIGTTNYPAEKQAMDEVERIYDQYDVERARGTKADTAKLQALQEQLKVAIEKANTYVIPNAYPEIIDENGGVGMNAETAVDATQFFYSFPSNRIELWFLLEAERFAEPVFREFYKERDVVREERRMRTESDPEGMLVEALQATAFEAHPYRVGSVGWASDIENFRLTEAVQFYRKYYVPANITIAIVGDVDPKQARVFAEKYFGRIPAGPLPLGVRTVEPPQVGPKTAEVESPSQPLALIAYKRPDENDKDDPVFDVISDILSAGRTSMLYTDMVRDKRLSLAAQTGATYPGGKYPGLFVFFLAPNLGHTLDDNEKECYAVIDRLKNEKVDEETLKRVKTRIRAGLIRQLDSNEGLATQLTFYYVNYGDWKKMFTGLDDIDRVTADDVQRVARKYFVPESRTAASIAAPAGAGISAPEAQGEAK
jgi:predicted Zn-dependent peptidase